MKNTYVAIGVLIVVVVLAFVFGKRETGEPQKAVDNTPGVQVAAELKDGSYTIDTSASVIRWRGEFVTGKGEEGTVSLKSGKVVILNGKITGGEFEIDMQTIKDAGGKQMLEDHLKSDDFFSVAKYPSATFRLTVFEPSKPSEPIPGKYVIGGRLTVRGIEKPISFPVTISSLEDGSVKAESSFAINRTEWDVKYNSASIFSNLGDKVIRDAVEIGLDFKAIKE